MADTPAVRPSDVVRRTIRGAVSLGGGQVAAQILNIGGTLVLARLLTPAEFGLFAILTFFLALLTALGDLGLGMSLVRRPAEPSDADYRAVSSFQQIVSVGVALVTLAATPWVVRAYGLTQDGWWLFPVMSVAILADSVRFLPLARLERQLAFERVGAVEIIQALVFNAVLLALAVRGFHAVCFPMAVVVRSVVGAVVAVMMGPRLTGWRWSWSAVEPYLAFGLPFRGIHLITVLKNSLVPICVGLLLGRASVGRLEWAAMVAGFPLTGLILLQRLYVGSFGRLQEHPMELREFVKHVIWVAHAVVAPLAFVTVVLIDPIVRVVFGDAWLSAVPLFFWLWLGCLIAPTLAPLTGLLHALGQSRVVFRATLVGTLATWIAGVPLVLAFGEVGVAIASLAVHVSGITIWRAAHRAVGFNGFGVVALIWGSGAVAGASAWWLQSAFSIASVPQLLLCGAVAVLTYVFALGTGGLTFLWPNREALSASNLRRDTVAFLNGER